MLIVIVVVGLHGYALSVSDTSHQRNLACLVFLWVLHLFPHSPKTCMFGEFVGCTVGGDVRVCVCLSVLAL